MWAEVHGERKKVACGPCIRGHRSSKCDHRDRVLIEVRKPGRPLSDCPHPSGSCACDRVVINYTIPKSSECACPSATIVGNIRIQKSRRKSTAVNSSSLEKAIRAGLDAETDTSSFTHTPSETSGSNTASLPSSASSTPRLLPVQSAGVSSYSQPKPAPEPVQKKSCCSGPSNQGSALSNIQSNAMQKKSCCSGPSNQGSAFSNVQSNAMQKKSCCSGPSNQGSALSNVHSNAMQQYGQQYKFPAQPQPGFPQYQNFDPHMARPTTLPYNLGAPIYNHSAAAYHQPAAVPMSPLSRGPMSPHGAGAHIGQRPPEHNCHCGESCSCFGCAAHPNNATMMEYVRAMARYQHTGDFGGMAPPLYDMPTYPHQPGFGAEAAQPMNFNYIQQGMPTLSQTAMNFQASLDMSALSNVSTAMPGSWQQPPYSDPINFTMPTPAQNHLPSKLEHYEATPAADSPGDGKEEETPTLSPSSYFWNEMSLPGCSDATGTCQCGEGCACVGCITHGGHTGVHLESPATTENNAFPDFSADAGLNLDGTTDYMGFNARQT
ncbi:hypothetical protein EJ02DRAFT_13142 [Clathrospora elynae]|uniref:Copper-fist domain-containing protein n=1 Tax=Clathrospora elynae TaxID=706981 RepID=A0A6A5T1U3_9PLEO|nr:hypothetical protein EJ02DRAFT_13142 [Clathrospora elynae]